ncbi:SIS domain-containing protein [Psychrosphaera sp. F3M07]|jgi:glucosamine--fructose-6-phosphate aminotransferase (isomerizing)|uniref:SIS domain-containing protein n=1 Tax=Psychrosphaera aquimarina TaxID=2044854 RepID=A0ABU3R2I6_9GAMM|nr:MULTISPECIES: SIS domain-containing protein [Psychrosphaera]MBU2919281.1 SIS domain-containing protein [Psychrosphaera sp. F3M07]MDU0113880.1 SIS domain-containing protein [Psychrosphaera aquimarina]
MLTNTIMEREAREAPTRIQQQIEMNNETVIKLGETLRQLAPKFVFMVGRGSSDHAGVFGKYLIEVETGTPVVAAAPSVKSVFGTEVNLAGSAVIVISQSGRSPDILSQAEIAKKQGALCIALVNDQSSPLAEIADVVIPLNVGEEKAVAATKSYLATLSALLHVVAHWKNDQSLISAVNQLPEVLAKTVDEPVQLKAEAVAGVDHLVVMGRGFGYALSREVALKLKEVCGIQAESFSSAEFLHGPVTLVEGGLDIISLDLADESKTSHDEQINEVKSRGATVTHIALTNNTIANRIAPLTLLQRFYIDVAHVAVSRGVDPDAPAGLNKVTKTL